MISGMRIRDLSEASTVITALYLNSHGFRALWWQQSKFLNPLGDSRFHTPWQSVKLKEIFNY